MLLFLFLNALNAFFRSFQACPFSSLSSCFGLRFFFLFHQPCMQDCGAHSSSIIVSFNALPTDFQTFACLSLAHISLMSKRNRWQLDGPNDRVECSPAALLRAVNAEAHLTQTQRRARKAVEDYEDRARWECAAKAQRQVRTAATDARNENGARTPGRAPKQIMIKSKCNLQPHAHHLERAPSGTRTIRDAHHSERSPNGTRTNWWAHQLVSAPKAGAPKRMHANSHNSHLLVTYVA